MKKIGVIMACALLGAALLTACSADTASAGPEKIRLAYSGSAFDLPLVAAYQNGYFEEEGLKVVLVAVKEGELGENIQEGTVDGGTADAGILEEIYRGLPAKIGGGVRGACVEILALAESGVAQVKDLEGKKIGIKSGNGGTAAAAAALEVLEQSVEWIVMDKEELPLALADGRIDALVHWQGEEPEITEEVTIIYQNSGMGEGGMSEHNHGDKPHFYESFAVLSEKLATEDPESASVLLSAWMKGVNAVGEDFEYQLDLAGEGGFITNTSQNAEVMCYMFDPGVKTVPQNLRAIAGFQKSQGLLGKEAEVNDFIDNVFIKLLPEWG